MAGALMSRVALRAALLVAWLLGAAPVALAQDLSGRWYGEGYQPRGYTQWLSERRPDGTFFVEFREYKDCTLVYQSREAGRWSFSDGVYSTTTTSVEGSDAYYYYSYVLLAFSGSEMEYQHIGFGTLFKARRVSDDFEWPGCDRSKVSALPDRVGAMV